jgi:DNA-binding LacI/PurR family transcriptional regulator
LLFLETFHINSTYFKSIWVKIGVFLATTFLDEEMSVCYNTVAHLRTGCPLRTAQNVNILRGISMTIKPSLTIDDIARELGVSKTTVSRAISGKGRISAATRERVLAYIEKHNYKPNASAKSLAESRTYNIALVLPRDFIKLDFPFIRQSMSTIVDEAYTMNYNVMLCLSTETESTPLIRTLDYRKVDGVILPRTVENDPVVELLIKRDIPFATLGTLPAKYQGRAIVEADHDQYGGCCAFTKAVLAGNPTCTALLGNDLSYIVNQSRLSGFRKACQELEIPLEQTPVRMGINDLDVCREVVEDLLAQGVRRFLCMDEDVCTRTIEVLRSNGLTIPGDAQIASFADTDQLTGNVPPISALSFDPAELGRAACREFINALNDEDYDPKPLLGYKIRLRHSMI